MLQRSFARANTLAIITALICAGLASSLMAQTQPTPRFATLAPRYLENLAAPATSTVTHWSGTLSAGGTGFSMVGTDPKITNTTTTVTAFLIPVRIVITPTPTGIFDPSHVLPNGRTVIQNTALSPIFNSGIDFVQGGVDLGNTQYIDAFQRGNFWGDVSTNTNYHVLLNLVTLPEVTISDPAGTIRTEFGVRAALVDINLFDAKLQQIISGNSQITPDSFVIALTYNTYLTQGGGCCIGGYHSAFGSASAPQTYSHFTYIDRVGAFAQDVSALSHEVGEWIDDPFINNPGCGGLLETGDPLEGEANFGGFPYTLNGFTYNLQDLVFLQYFGQSPSTSVNGWFSFQNANLAVCSNGQ
ncbi:MAG TPA: hypothetical protein VFT65_06740 [Candidatus Angelobacter sp.]|nr:hypothetical protein [Candidatus Angelobacter sp.]